MNKRPRILILGCGWVGYPLALTCKNEGYSLNVSTTQTKKLAILRAAQLNPFLLSLPCNETSDLLNHMAQADIIVITLPFKRKKGFEKIYIKQIRNITQLLPASTRPWLIFTSSTSIYKKTNRLVTESDAIDTDSERAKILHQVENTLLQHPHSDTTIVRLAGLYGYDRSLRQHYHTIKKTDYDQPLNLIHRDDAVNILLTIITQNKRNALFNAVCPHHPLKTPSKPSNFKLVCHKKLVKELNYQFMHPHVSNSH